ncbi:MAG: Gfo/Idh/MocA family protein [Phycisphaeraceae bacterium]
MDRLRWGIIGTGAIASDFAKALKGSDKCVVVNAVGSSLAKSDVFAEAFGLAHSSASIDALLGDDGVDAVYIATPHPMHEQQALAAIDAGKAVLCEKPITVDAAGAERVIGAARDTGVFLMEAYMYRCHPLIAEVLEKLEAGVIGEVRHVRADFGFYMPRQPEHRLFSPALAGGGILDVGGYPASFARLIAGVVNGTPFDEPTDLQATGTIGPTGVDELAVAQLRFATGMTAQLTCAVHHDVGTGAWVFGDGGVLHLPDPWIPQSDRHGLTTGYTVTRNGRPPESYTVSTDRAVYAIEAHTAADAIRDGALQVPRPGMSWDDTLGNMRLLDAWRNQVGVEVATQA